MRERATAKGGRSSKEAMRHGAYVAVTGLFCLTVFLQSSAAATTYQVAQEDAPGSGVFTVQGYIDAIETTLDPASYYGWDTVMTSFTGPEPTPTNGTSYVFLLRTVPGDELSLVFVHDKFDASSGNARTSFFVSGDPDGCDWLEEDDPVTYGDTYTGISGDSTFTAWQSWTGGTDGGVIGTLDGSWSVTMEFTAAPSGLATWSAYSGGGSEVPLSLVPNRRVSIAPLDGAVGVEGEVRRSSWSTVKLRYSDP